MSRVVKIISPDVVIVSRSVSSSCVVLATSEDHRFLSFPSGNESKGDVVVCIITYPPE